MTLAQHPQEMQDLACKLDGIMEGLSFLMNTEECHGARIVLAEVGHEMASKLYAGLDKVALPEGKA